MPRQARCCLWGSSFISRLCSAASTFSACRGRRRISPISQSQENSDMQSSARTLTHTHCRSHTSLNSNANANAVSLPLSHTHTSSCSVANSSRMWPSLSLCRARLCPWIWMRLQKGCRETVQGCFTPLFGNNIMLILRTVRATASSMHEWLHFPLC